MKSKQENSKTAKAQPQSQTQNKNIKQKEDDKKKNNTTKPSNDTNAKNKENKKEIPSSLVNDKSKTVTASDATKSISKKEITSNNPEKGISQEIPTQKDLANNIPEKEIIQEIAIPKEENQKIDKNEIPKEIDQNINNEAIIHIDKQDNQITKIENEFKKEKNDNQSTNINSNNKLENISSENNIKNSILQEKIKEENVVNDKVIFLKKIIKICNFSIKIPVNSAIDDLISNRGEIKLSSNGFKESGFRESGFNVYPTNKKSYSSSLSIFSQRSKEFSDNNYKQKPTFNNSLMKLYVLKQKFEKEEKFPSSQIFSNSEVNYIKKNNKPKENNSYSQTRKKIDILQRMVNTSTSKVINNDSIKSLKLIKYYPNNTSTNNDIIFPENKREVIANFKQQIKDIRKHCISPSNSFIFKME